MSERSVSVRLIAINSQYDAAMKHSGDVTRDLGTQAELMGTKSDTASGHVNKLGKAAQDAKPQFNALALSAAAVGPALLPIAGFAVGNSACLLYTSPSP